MENDIEKQVYEEAAKRYGDSPKALLYNNPKGQLARFYGIKQLLKGDIYSLYDVGCGHGDFYNYIVKSIPTLSYRGYDIIPDFVKKAQKEYGEDKFAYTFEDCVKSGKADATVLIGVFTRNENDKISKIKKMLDRCWEYTEKVMCVTFLTDNAFEKDSTIFYLSIEEIAKILSRYSEKWVINRSELPYCAMCGIYRD